MDFSQLEPALSCPRCQQRMRKATAPEGIVVQSCLPCRTVWLEGGAIAGAGWGEGLPQPSQTHDVDRNCPRCRSPLTGLVYQGEAGDLHLDYCEICAGLSLSQSDLSALRTMATAARPQATPAPHEPTTGPDSPVSSDIVLAPTDVLASRGRGLRSLSILVLILAVGAAVYFYTRVGEAPAPAPIPGEKLIKTEDSSVAASALFTAVPALQEYYRLRDRWPADAAELDRFAVEQGLSFRMADFAELAFEEKKNGGLVLRYTPKGAQRARTFHLRPPADIPEG